MFLKESKIDPFSTAGHIPDKFIGDLELHDCDFFYPSRPDQQVSNVTNTGVLVEKRQPVASDMIQLKKVVGWKWVYRDNQSLKYLHLFFYHVMQFNTFCFNL